jgi:membrane protein
MASAPQTTSAAKRLDGERAERQKGVDLNIRRPRRAVGAIVDAFAENDLLTYASAIAWQTLFAIVPLALAGFALLGFLDLREVWERDVVPELRERVSPDAFSVIRRTVERILESQRGFWLTFGVVFAVWQVSGAMRAVMGVLGRIYETDDDRSFWRRQAVSVGLALVAIAGLGGAGAIVLLGPRLAARLGDQLAIEIVSTIVRWAVALALMLVVVGVLIRFAPARRQPVKWVGLGSLLCVGSWAVASIGFGFYATSVADYESVFGSLASVIVLMTYLYVSAVAFLVGAQLDALLRAQAGAPGGQRAGR